MKSFITFIFSLSLLLAHADEKKAIVAVYDLEGNITESGQGSGGLFGLGGDGRRPLTHFDLVRSMKQAAEDERVKGVVLDLGGAGLSLAQLQEIHRCLQSIRKAGKDVWFYTESLNNGTALIGAAANHFTLLPEGNVMLTGMYSESMYFKGLLDKVGVKAEVIHIGDFKSAGETFYRTGPSEYAQKQSDLLFDSIYGQILGTLSQGRKIKAKELQQLIDQGLISPQQAKEVGLVDALKYRTDFVSGIRAHYGEGTSFDRTYALPDLDGPDINSFMDVMKLAFQSGKSKKRRKDYLAVVALEGNITDASVAPVRKEVLKLAKDDKCLGLVLRVNSPGGSALASDVLWEATDEFKASNKPFVVSMGAVAASGGYYVSAGADHIFAETGTITGSIGVVGMKFVLGGAMEKLGITVHTSQRGKNAGLMNMHRPYTPEETTIIRKSMLDVYATFKKRITDGRGDRIVGDLEQLAGGRVYSGQDALKIGLIDKIGGLNEAIAHVATLAELEPDSYDVHLTPAPKSGIEGMFAGPEKPDKDGEFIQAGHAQRPANLLQQQIMNSPSLQMLTVDQRQSLEQFIKRIQAYSEHHILLIGQDFTIPTL
ncbi:signal peptide peptidase SppA [Verrucomicrobiaceae bacterium N1E253]|uniref:Signal peptide peptidase SppA n=1 Tax=Oceaniferula marina TaxID=2748318 RepID=A0A851GQG1_9BACT|nr:signal peptide peptidase SppA [Oceaniferula marina]NWK56394.1 signal peptide peptidase SppA [Oceaniferula marina]